MSRRLRPSLLVVLLVLVPVLLSACGSSHSRISTGTYAGENGAGAPYLNVGPLVYEVQQSRQLSPYDTEDMSYLSGLTPAQRALAPGEEWFGVFLQVFNHHDIPYPAATGLGLVLTDTQRNTYVPISPGASNEFAYRPKNVPGRGRLPEPDTVAANGPTQGALLLYKIKTVSLDNRPLEIKIVDPADVTQTASAELDV
jgi:hypothetical protein